MSRWATILLKPSTVFTFGTAQASFCCLFVFSHSSQAYCYLLIDAVFPDHLFSTTIFPQFSISNFSVLSQLSLHSQHLEKGVFLFQRDTHLRKEIFFNIALNGFGYFYSQIQRSRDAQHYLQISLLYRFMTPATDKFNNEIRETEL